MSISDEQKEIVLLSIIEAMGGQTDAGDERWSWLQWFCTDEVGKEADTFNRCIDKGWLKSSHDSDTDHSVAWITDDGRAALSAAAKVRAGREGIVEFLQNLASAQTETDPDIAAATAKNRSDLYVDLANGFTQEGK